MSHPGSRASKNPLRQRNLPLISSKSPIIGQSRHPLMPPSESDFIDWIRSQQYPSALVKLAAGDDLAILKWRSDDVLLVGGDQVLDGVHFDSAKHAPRDIGRKAMNPNLSEAPAMASLPAPPLPVVPPPPAP